MVTAADEPIRLTLHEGNVIGRTRGRRLVERWTSARAAVPGDLLQAVSRPVERIVTGFTLAAVAIPVLGV